VLYWRESLLAALALAPGRDEFTGVDSEREMADSADRRAAERIGVNAGTRCAFVGRVVDDVGPVKVRDVSMEGIGLVLMRSIPVGTLLSIGLATPDKGFSKMVMVQVTHVTPITGAFLVGGIFTEPLTYQELTTLVM
jgi:hypothetical protein